MYNSHALVELHTESGIGYGSASTTGELCQAAMQALVPLLVGESISTPREVWKLWEKLDRSTQWLGGGAVTAARSALDIASWDALGKHLDQPVWQLLNEVIHDGANARGSTPAVPFRTKVKAYGSVTMPHTPEEMEKVVSAVAAQGFKAVKIAWGPFGLVSDELDEALVRAARNALPSEVDLLVDGGGSSPDFPGAAGGRDWRWALKKAEMLARYDVKLYEEPLQPGDYEGFRQLTDASPVKIAGMEVVQCLPTFQHWISNGYVDYAQPDATHVGGLTAMCKITEYAEENGCTVVPHGWNTAFGLAADLHLAAVSKRAMYIEYQVSVKCTSRDMVYCTCRDLNALMQSYTLTHTRRMMPHTSVGLVRVPNGSRRRWTQQRIGWVLG
jgi:L-alanine-DL-glutamate epimerase-like enolase superfamily enzyme